MIRRTKISALPPKMILAKELKELKGNPVKTWEFENHEAVSRYCLAQLPMLHSDFCRLYDILPDTNLSNSTKVGIEIECENLAHRVGKSIPMPSVWQVKQDGSLRNNGCEFVSPALAPKDVRTSLAVILAYINAVGNPDFSWRTSIHIHLDCAQLNIVELQRLLILYFVFEESLFNFANPARKETNIFCTPLRAANFYVLYDFLHCDPTKKTSVTNTFAALISKIRKYSALNLEHLTDFGTLEFRHLRGTNDPIVLGNWIRLLLRLFKAATKIPTDVLHTLILQLNTNSAYDQFTELVFEEDKNLIFQPRHTGHLAAGISLMKELLYGYKAAQMTKATTKSGLYAFLTLKEAQKKNDSLKIRSANHYKNLTF